MARIRSVKPTFWTDEKIGVLTRDVRLTFLGLISAMADDHGRLSGVPRIIRGAVYPFDEDISTAEIERHLDILAEAKLITRYEVNGAQYIHIRNWLRHQKVDKPSPSLIPEPPRTIDDDSTSVRRTFPTERSGADGNGEEGIRSGADVRARATRSHIVDNFFKTFYLGATQERIAEVKQQLRDSLSPEGVRIRKGETAKARDLAHLEQCVRETLTEKVRDPDKAIIIVLKKLSNPELNAQNQTVTEAASARTKVIERKERQYHDAKIAAAKAWAKDNEDQAADLNRRAIDEFPGEMQIAEVMRTEWILEEISKRIEFPSFEDWSAGAVTAA